MTKIYMITNNPAGLNMNNDKITPTMVSRLRLAFWLALIGVTLAAFADTVGDLHEYPGVDLRARVVGVRAMLLGLDPYFIPASSDQIQTLQDPVRYAAICSRCTYTPALLYLYAPFAKLSYPVQRYIWFGIEWSALIGSILLLRAILRGKVLKEVFTAISLIFFADGTFWRLHLERGQYYIFVVFLFSLTAWFCLRRRAQEQDDNRTLHDRLWYGIPLGIAAAIRLTPLAVLLPLWAARYRRTAIGMVITTAACIFATFPHGGAKLWVSYFRNASLQSRIRYVPEFDAQQHAALPPLPQTVEGVNFDHLLDVPNLNITFATDVLWPLWGKLPSLSTVGTWNLICNLGAAATCLLFAIVLWRNRSLNPTERFAVSILCASMVEFFLPIRVTYADVGFLVPVALFMPCMLRSSRGYIWLSVVLLGLALGHSVLPTWTGLSPVIRPILLFTGMTMFLLIRLFELSRPETLSAGGDAGQRLLGGPADIFQEEPVLIVDGRLKSGNRPAITN